MATSVHFTHQCPKMAPFTQRVITGGREGLPHIGICDVVASGGCMGGCVGEWVTGTQT